MQLSPPDNIYEDVRILKKVVSGDPENLKEFPGLAHEMRLQNVSIETMNKTLLELTSAVQWISRLIIGSVIVAVLGLLMKVGGAP